MKKRFYFDHNATSPTRPAVRKALEEFLSEPMANASSVHTSGRRIRKIVEDAREEVAKFVGAKPSEIIFTSGGTEANQLAWKGFSKPGARILTSRVEHPSVLGAAKRAQAAGANVTWLDVDINGQWNSQELKASFESGLDFVSLQHANNETGMLWPIHEIAAKLRGTETVFHTDAVQVVGKREVIFETLGVHSFSLSGHKVGALPGIGALVLRRKTPWEPLWEGGYQEKGRRTGTENILGIVSLGAACKFLREDGGNETQRIAALRDRFERELVSRIAGAVVTAQAQPRLPNTTHVSFENVDGESLLVAADLAGIDCSTGSACASGSLEPSHVLLAMGFSPERAHSSIRFSFGWSTVEEDVTFALDVLPKLVAQARARTS